MWLAGERGGGRERKLVLWLHGLLQTRAITRQHTLRKWSLYKCNLPSYTHTHTHTNWRGFQIFSLNFDLGCSIYMNRKSHLTSHDLSTSTCWSHWLLKLWRSPSDVNLPNIHPLKLVPFHVLWSCLSQINNWTREGKGRQLARQQPQIFTNLHVHTDVPESQLTS